VMTICFRRTVVALFAALTLLASGQVPRAADDPRAREIVDGVARLFVSRSCIATLEMQIVKDDRQRKIGMQFWSLGESDMLVRIVQPPEDAGTAILKVGNKSWNYLPKAKRTVELPPSMLTTPLMGSQFTLDDLVRQSRLTADYAVATSFEGQRDGAAVIELTLTPKPDAAVVWGKMMLEVRQADRMPIWQRFYDGDGALVRQLSFSDYKTVSGRLIPTRLIMQPTRQTGVWTTVTYETIVFDQPISADMFSLGRLQQ
jgi:outer membrane lipoprotein-sorting protein